MSDHDRTPAKSSTPSEGARQAGRIVTRLRAEIAWEPEVGELLTQAADEIERLTITGAEREAIEVAAAWLAPHPSHHAATLRRLLDRTKNGSK